MDFITIPIGYILKFFSNICGNSYILAILLFAILTELIMALVFGIRQQKNSIKQARLRPKEAAIRKKYAGRDDKPTQQKMTQEIQELYQKEGYNPMGGCLPLLIQFPILIALYNIVIDPLKYICGLSQDAIAQVANIIGMDTTRGTMAMLGPIEKMGYEAFQNVEGFTPEVFENMPNLTVFGILDLSVMPSECMNLEAIKTVSGWLVLLVPVLTFLSYFFSMKLTRKFSYQPVTDTQQSQMGCSNKMMDITMPLFSVFISFGVPAALGIYWIFKSLLGIVKQIILYYAIPLPKFTEEDYKAAEKEVFARADKSERVEKSGRVVRSLHHIDDEDFEDTREAALKHKEALAAQEKEEKEKNAQKKSGLFSGVTLKKDDRKAEEKENNDNNNDPQDENKSEE
ncbi:MAG: YidC/Oxa1 family membrane protein insertase [Clostridia bacterium]|nr:YidC/Oxa1 family membrane protein insertase [Clostridia bacterium]